MRAQLDSGALCASRADRQSGSGAALGSGARAVTALGDPRPESTCAPHAGSSRLADRGGGRAAAGVVSHAQLTALGLGRRAIEHRVAVGRLHALHRGVYAVGRPDVTAAGRLDGRGAGVRARGGAERSVGVALWGLRPWAGSRVARRGADAGGRGRSRGSWCTVRGAAPGRGDGARRDRGDDGRADAPRPRANVATALGRCVEESERQRVFDLRDVDAVLGVIGDGRARAAWRALSSCSAMIRR